MDIKKAKIAKRNRLVHAFLCLGYALLGTVGLAAVMVAGFFWAAWIIVPVVAYGYYGMVFWFFAFADASTKLNCMLAIEECGLLTYSEISAELGIKERAVKAHLSRALGRSYVTRYGIGKDGVIRV